MSWIKATVRFLHAWQHPDEIEREVEAELRFHIEMRTRANIEDGMMPKQAQLAARQSFGDFDRIKVQCCEISRRLPFDSRALRMGLHIAIAVIAGATSLWAVNVRHENLVGVLWQLVAIAVLTRAFIVGRRPISTEQFQASTAKNKGLSVDGCKQRAMNIASHDEQGLTPVERMFNAE
jgi:hypothetical protein